MEVDDNRKKKIWKKKTKQIKSRTESSSFSSENKDSVDQINIVDSTNPSFFSKPPGDLNQLSVNGNEAFIHGKNEEFWMEKQAEMEAVIADLQHQKDLLSQKEKNNMQSLERLHGDNTQLSLKVMELEKSQSYLLEENEKLLKKISIFQSQIQILERVISSNNLKVDESGVKMRSIDSDPSTHPTAHETQVLESSVRDSLTEEEAPEVRNNGDMESEIAGGKVAEGGVPLSHAPLIGAPFRFISFVASYVSGADLVSIQQ